MPLQAGQVRQAVGYGIVRQVHLLHAGMALQALNLRGNTGLSRTVLSWPSCAGERTSCTTLAASRKLRLKSCSVKMHRCVWGEGEGEAGSDIGCDGVGLGR